MKRIRFAWTALACMVGGAMGVVGDAQAQNVVISQVYGGGGNAGSTWRQDFIELHNNGNAPAFVNGWSVQYASSLGTAWQMTMLNGVIPPGGYYLIQEAQGAGGTMNLPAPQAVGTIAMSATTGKVALVNNNVLLTGACPLGPNVVDFVGFGLTANCFEGGGPAPQLSNTTAAVRNSLGCQDTNNNAGDFVAGTPNPRNAAMPLFNCGPSLLPRPNAVSILLSPTSGVTMDLTRSTVWSPFVNAGSGPGFEGLYPVGTRVDVPAGSGEAGVTAGVPSYVFWIDDEPSAQFAHPCRIVLMDATQPSPSVGNGGIIVQPVNWWPVITRPGDPAGTSYFRLLIENATNAPAGPINPQGLLGGPAIAPADIQPAPAPGPGGAMASRRGIILIGDDREDFQNDAPRHQSDLKTRSMVPMANVETHGQGAALDKNGFCMAIDNHVMTLMTDAMNGMPPSRIYVRISTHGTNPNDPRGRGIVVKNGEEFISSAELCAKLKKYAKFGVPVHVVINACFSGGLVDATRWGLPAGSTVITSANGNRSSYGGTYTDENAMRFTGSAFQYGLTKCGMDARANTNGDTEVDDCEAFAWLTSQKPCYTWRDGKMRYPGGRPDGANEDVPDPLPQKSIVGINAKSMNYNAQNGTGAAKTDFHIIFEGDVRGGTVGSWRSNAMDQIGGVWDGTGMVTHDPAANTTMVCYENTTDPVANGSFIHFGYARANGNLRVRKQWWTPTGDPPANADKAPGAGASQRVDPMSNTVILRLENASLDAGGWGQPIFVTPRYWVAPIEIELVQLNLVGVQGMLGSGTLLSPPASMPSDGAMEFVLPLSLIPAGHRIVLGTQVSWSLNGTNVHQLEQFEAIGSAPGCVADVDDGSFTGTPDGGVTIDDLLYYLFIFENGFLSADVDDGSFTGTRDGGVTIDDLLYYLFRFESGC